MGVEIRPAVPADATGIRRVARETWHATYDEIIGSEAVDTVVDEWYAIEGLEASMDRADGRFLVGVTGGDVVGFAQGVLDDPADLPRIYVAPDRWGEGLGSALLDRIEGWLRAEGADRLRLSVAADNEIGNAFYEKRGYEIAEQRAIEVAGLEIEEYVREREL
ncbi:N-acetyltransferase [Halobacteriales archaeon QS_1_67_19]|nr:MAG: N-acetyltransferase [Halobacteriales archaeon QS_1_67_19]